MRYRCAGLFCFLLIGFCLFGCGLAKAQTHRSTDSRLVGGFRNAPDAGWIFVHLQGSPSAIGFQHGYLLTPEIEDTKQAISLSVTHEVNHNW
jgi:hypothetical protein